MTANATQFTADIRRYAELIRSAIEPSEPFTPTTENATSVQVERGIILARTLTNDSSDETALLERLIDLSDSGRIDQLAIVDRSGHHRPVYRPLLIYAWLRAFSLRYETLNRADFGRWDEALRPWCDLLEHDLGQIVEGDTWLTAARAPSAAEAAWSALALHVAGKVFLRDAWTDLAADTFGRLIRAQQTNGAFLAATPDDNPELLWYYELVILHAAASYAVQAEDRTTAAAVGRATTFHTAETQPDHATTQPWGVFAFIWNASTRTFADQLMHSSMLQSAQGRNGLPLILLADALYCLKLFL